MSIPSLETIYWTDICEWGTWFMLSISKHFSAFSWQRWKCLQTYFGIKHDLFHFFGSNQRSQMWTSLKHQNICAVYSENLKGFCWYFCLYCCVSEWNNTHLKTSCQGIVLRSVLIHLAMMCICFLCIQHHQTFSDCG